MKKILTLLIIFIMAVGNRGFALADGEFDIDFEDPAFVVGNPFSAPNWNVISGSTIVQLDAPMGKSLEIKNKSANGRAIRMISPAITYDFVVEFDFMQKEKKSIYAVCIPGGGGYDQPNYPFEISSTGDDIRLYHSVGTTGTKQYSSIVVKYQANVAYRIKVFVGMKDKRLRIWVNGEEKLTDTSLTFSGNDVKSIGRLDFQNGSTDDKAFYIGKLSLRKYMDASSLLQSINEAQSYLDAASIGESIGQYPESAFTAYQKSIDDAKQIYDEMLLNPDADMISKSLSDLANAKNIFNASKIVAIHQIFSDDFSSGAISGSWTVIGNTTVATEQGNSFAAIKTTVPNDQSRLIKDFGDNELCGLTTIEFSFMQKQKSAIYGLLEVFARPWNEENLAFQLKGDGTGIIVRHGSSGKTDYVMTNYNAGQWYHMKLVVDVPNKEFKIFVDGNQVLSSATLSFIGNNVPSLARLGTRIDSSSSESEKALYIDNYKVSKDIGTDFELIANKLSNQIGNAVYKDINLPLALDGAAITWNSSDASIITTGGKVTRPQNSDAAVTLTATLFMSDYSYVSNFVITVIRLYSGDIINDAFESGIGQLPTFWSKAETQKNASVKNINGRNCFEIEATVTRDVPVGAASPNGVISFEFMQQQKNAVESIFNANQLFHIKSDGENILFCHASKPSGDIIVSNYIQDNWYSFDIFYDFASNKLAVSVNGVIKLNCDGDGSFGITQVGAKSLANTIYLDNVIITRPQVEKIELINSVPQIIIPSKKPIKEIYIAHAMDNKGRTLIGADLAWSISYKNGDGVSELSISDGILEIAPNAKGGTVILKAYSADNDSIFAETEIILIKQKIKKIEIIGPTSVKAGKTYAYTAMPISEYDTVLPTTGLVWSATGAAIDSQTGVLQVNNNASDSITITATIDNFSQSIEVNISNDSKGNSGGGGGGGKMIATPIVNNPEVQTQEQYIFDDISPSHWAWDAVDKLKELNIISGIDEKRFEPDGLVTRAQLVQMIVKAFHLSADGNVRFSDVDNSQWYYDSVVTASNLDIVSGYPDGRFGGNEKISRQDMAAIIFRVMKNDISKDTNLDFTDNAKISDYAKEAVATLSGAGLINGKDNNQFCPQENATRAETAAILYRILERIGK